MEGGLCVLVWRLIANLFDLAGLVAGFVWVILVKDSRFTLEGGIALMISIE